MSWFAARERISSSASAPTRSPARIAGTSSGSPSAGFRPRLRELIPCHCTASGKALLAWREPWREAVLTQPLTAFTDRTAIGPQWLRREFARIVARGYSIEDREFDAQARSLAAPVFSAIGEAVAALAVVGPATGLPAERYSEIGEAVMAGAQALSHDLP